MPATGRQRTGKNRAERMTAFGSRHSRPERPVLGEGGRYRSSHTSCGDDPGQCRVQRRAVAGSRSEQVGSSRQDRRSVRRGEANGGSLGGRAG